MHDSHWEGNASRHRKTRIVRRIIGGQLFLAALAVAVFIAVVAGAARSATSGGPPPPWLKAQAASEATKDGDPTPTSLEYALTTARDAAPAMGLAPNDPSLQAPDRMVYLVVMTGYFVDASAFVPPGQPNPRGTTLTFAVDPATRLVTDFGLTNAPVDTSLVGSLTPFTLH